MLEIHEIKDLTPYSALLQVILSDNPHVIEAMDKGRCAGTAVFDYTEDTVRLLDIRCPEDLYLFDGIVRTVLFKGALLGLEKAELCAADDPQAHEALEKLGFLKNGQTIVAIADFLNKCEHCENSGQ